MAINFIQRVRIYTGQQISCQLQCFESHRYCSSPWSQVNRCLMYLLHQQATGPWRSCMIASQRNPLKPPPYEGKSDGKQSLSVLEQKNLCRYSSFLFCYIFFRFQQLSEKRGTRTAVITQMIDRTFPFFIQFLYPCYKQCY